jgi:hypothetical protein
VQARLELYQRRKPYRQPLPQMLSVTAPPAESEQ